MDPDPCSPLAILTGEEAPQGVESGSTLERFLSVEIVPGEPKFESAVDDLLGDGVWQRAFGGWVRWLAAQIDACATPGAPTDGLSRWTRQLADELEQVVDDIAASGRLTVRQAKVVAPLAVGLRMWCRFVAVAVVGEAEIGSLEADGTLVLTECAHRHAEVVMAPEDRGPAAVLDRLRQAAIGPRAWVDGPGMPQPADASHAELMGRAVGSTDGDLVALLPDIAARQIGMRSGAELVSALGELVVRDAQGRSRRVVSIRGQSVRCVCIRLSDWSGEDGAGVRAVAASASSFGSDESNEEF